MGRWKEKIERRLEALEDAQQHGGDAHSFMPVVATAVSEDTSITPFCETAPEPGYQPLSTDPPSSNTDGTTLNLSSNLGIFPAASVGTNTPRDTLSPTSDIISRGIISSRAAGECLDYFLKHLNQYLHHILSDRHALADVRARSPLLTAAICTVASFCSGSQSYKACYDAFVSQVSGMLFATHSSYDDVRALCIAAMWLDDIGPTLSGLGTFNEDG